MLQWFRSLFADTLKTGLLAALAAILPPAAVIWANGLGFLTTSYRVAGWAIAVAAGLAGVLVVSVGFNLVQ